MKGGNRVRGKKKGGKRGSEIGETSKWGNVERMGKEEEEKQGGRNKGKRK